MLDRARVMRRRQNNEVKVNHERWLVSYADFVTLLFAFFVVMYSVSQVSETKYKILSETLGHVFQPTSGKISPSEMTLDQQQVLDSLDETGEQKENLANLSDVKSSLESALGEFVKNGDVLITGEVSSQGSEQWIEISLDANLLFSSGRADLQNSARTTFGDVANILEPYDNDIEVAGHTDDQPISNNIFPNNWALSSARAVSVVNLLNSEGIKPQRLSAVGYGEFRPVADNSTIQGRQENRRVVIRVADHAIKTNSVDDISQNTQVLDEPDSLSDSLINNRSSEDTALKSNDSGISRELKPKTNNVAQEPTVIEPIQLKGGGLLFTSDPDLPRSNLK